METDVRRQLSMLTILHAACKVALDAFYAADSSVDRTLVTDLEQMVERTRLEIETLAT
jgi:hypothetical protein